MSFSQQESPRFGKRMPKTYDGYCRNYRYLPTYRPTVRHAMPRYVRTWYGVRVSVQSVDVRCRQRGVRLR
jgi:hypothetical protein